MSEPEVNNPFQSPTVLEHRRAAPPIEINQADRAPVKDRLPVRVAAAWMLFIFAATIHAMSALYFGVSFWGGAAATSVCAGFVVLYPSVFTWGLGLMYAFVMASICLGATIITHVDPHPRFFDVVPLLMYVGILMLMFTTSSYYLLRPIPEEPLEESTGEEG